jgi:hypothetical protein
VPVPRAMHERTYQRILGMLATTRPCGTRGRATLENTRQMNIAAICGGNAGTGLQYLTDGRCVEFVNLTQTRSWFSGV